MNNVQFQVDLINVILAIIAVIALIAALRQLNAMQQSSRQQELATRAGVLLGLDERFGSQSMQDATTEMTALIDRMNKIADEKWQHLAKNERLNKRNELFPEELERMRIDSPSEAYIRLMRICTFFDTVGYVTRYEYVPLRDVVNLFNPAIENAGDIFKAHIERLKDVYGEKVYGNFLWLIEESRKSIEIK